LNGIFVFASWLRKGKGWIFRIVELFTWKDVLELEKTIFEWEGLVCHQQVEMENPV
jgi:hypothetical protein